MIKYFEFNHQKISASLQITNTKDSFSFYKFTNFDRDNFSKGKKKIIKKHFK